MLEIPETVRAIYPGLPDRLRPAVPLVHLAPDGRVLLFFGTSGDGDHRRSLVARAGLAS